MGLNRLSLDNHRPQAFSQSNTHLLRPTAPQRRRALTTFVKVTG
jgi:hypothetical protein